MIPAIRTAVPVPDAVADLTFSRDPADQARQAGVMLVTNGACEDPGLREAHRHTYSARIAKANKHLARVGVTYGWEHLPGRKQKEYR